MLSQIVELAGSINTHIVAALLGRLPASYADSFAGFALACAEQAGDWHLRAYVLDSMAEQAIATGQPMRDSLRPSTPWSGPVIEQLIGPEVRAVDEIYIRMPTPDETRRLKLSTGTPVAVHYCTGYTQDERVVRVEYFVIPGDRHVIVYDRVHPVGTAD